MKIQISLSLSFFKLTVTMKDVVYWVSDAWNEASSDRLAKAWKQLLPESPATPESSDDEWSNDEVEIPVVL